MVRRHYPVLAPLSGSYSEPKGRFPRVTHPCATRPEGLVRLACVRHAASVRSEPESNSQVDVRSNLGGIVRRKTGISGSRSCTNSQSGVFAYLRHMSSPPKPKLRQRSIRNGISLTDRTPSPEAPGDRAAAHMSLHLNRQCQRADAYLPPVRLVPGSVVPTKKRRETATSLDKAASACWRRHIWVALQLVNVLFCKFLARPPFGSLNLAKQRRRRPEERFRLVAST